MNWVYLLQWMLVVVLLRMSYEVSMPAIQTNPVNVAVRPKQLEKSAWHSDVRSERVKRFTRLPPFWSRLQAPRTTEARAPHPG